MHSLSHTLQERLRDRYQIQQQLGKKAGRQTFLAIDNETQQPVVIKLLTFNKDLEWDDLKLFEREAETLKSLNHPAIPCYLDFFEVDLPHSKGLALVQSYIPAKSLEEHLKAGRRFSEPEVKQLAIALLEILSYLHSQQPPVIHRDIKPSNILLGERSGNFVGQVYLVDFGSVQTLAATEGGTITVVGTYGYMPPEQFGGRAVPASDLYSLGATLIYLATGKHPAELPQINLKLQFQKFVILDSWLVKWIEWLVEPSLDKRPNSAHTALIALKRELHGKTALLEPEFSRSHNQNWPKRPKPYLTMTPDRIRWNALVKTTINGVISGGVCTTLIPLLFWPEIGSLALMLFPLGAVLGVFMGLLNGLLIGEILTCYHLRGTSESIPFQLKMLLGVFSINTFTNAIFLAVIGLPFPGFIAASQIQHWTANIALSSLMGISSQLVAKWYFDEL